MNYTQSLKFLKENNILVAKVVVANEVESQLKKEITESKFERICTKIYNKWINSINPPNIWELVDEELTSRKLKGGC